MQDYRKHDHDLCFQIRPTYPYSIHHRNVYDLIQSEKLEIQNELQEWRFIFCDEGKPDTISNKFMTRKEPIANPPPPTTSINLRYKITFLLPAAAHDNNRLTLCAPIAIR